MQVKFLGQGYTSKIEKTVGEVIISSIESGDYDDSIWISAFSSSSVFEQLKPRILKFSSRGQLKIIVGIDQGGTSFDALSKLISLQVSSYVYHSSSSTIFHPKCYIFSGKSKRRIIIGSSNLTVNGLFNNIENSIQIDFEYGDIEGEKFYEDLKLFYKDIFDLTSPNIKPLSIELIRELSKLKLIPEKESFSNLKKNPSDKSVIDRIKELFPSLSRKRFPGLRKTKTKGEKYSGNLSAGQVSEPLSSEMLIWTKVNLPGSDVEFTKPGTNPTGRLKLVKAGHDIDQTKYFRDIAFRNLKWEKRSDNLKEDAIGKFQVLIEGINYGVYDLQITHNPKGDAGQNNYTTSISWSGVSDLIKKNDLRGKTLKLFRSKNLSFDFVLEIG